jgi:hypothetical protein
MQSSVKKLQEEGKDPEDTPVIFNYVRRKIEIPG